MAALDQSGAGPDSVMAIALAAVAGLALLYLGGEALVRGAAALALRLGISPLAVGLTVVAFGTSVPELVVSLDAALAGADDIAVGNVVGSNIANILLILGLSALIRPVAVEAKIFRTDAPLAVVASLALIGMLADGVVSRTEGGLLLTALAAFTVLTFRQARRESGVVRAELATAAPQAAPGAVASGLLVLLGVAALVAGGHLLVTAAVELALVFSVSQAVIGLTMVAVGTSLPELATSVVAAARDRGDIAVGNVVGSNLFNILGILGVTAVAAPLSRGAVGWASLAVMLAAAVLLVPLLGTGSRLSGREGAVLLAAYAAYVTWLLVS